MMLCCTFLFFLLLAALLVLFNWVPATSALSALSSPSRRDAVALRCSATRSQTNNYNRILPGLHQTVSNDNGDETSKLLARAAKLRKEAQELESRTPGRANRNPREKSTQLARPVEYAEVADSVWTITYRFSDEPEPSDDDVAAENMQRRRFFSGKATLKFRADGYTDLISQETTRAAEESAKITKVWGWDLEVSGEDDKDSKEGDGEKEYLLFSIDFDLPKSADKEKTSLRFYFQARQQKDSRTNRISFSEGTVTIKRDFVKSSARWGFFSPAGILAQFRQVGNFVAKETTAS